MMVCAGFKYTQWSVRGTDSEIVRAHHDMQAQMINRKERLQFLIRFINENGVLTKVMDTTCDILLSNLSIMLVDVSAQSAEAGYQRREIGRAHV